MYSYLRRLKSQILLQKNYLNEAYSFWKLTVKYNASNHTDDDIQKMQYTLSRETHTIEKGMSMRNPRRGFGQQKVTNLITRLRKYVKLYLNEDSVFDIQIKRLHEYKRQQMNALYVIYKYLEIKSGKLPKIKN